ncbi:hypothetical protein BGX28_002141 [Mortierella sp. GBA30]|nr:hypothetical protein BGX28_002141 [Mortierella sp. GBA30]
MALDPRKLKVNELKEHLQLAGLSVIGKKEELVARLLEHQKTEEDVVDTEGPPTGTGEAFDWEDSKFDVDDLAPPADSTTTDATAATESKSSVTSSSAAAVSTQSAPPATTTTDTTSEKDTGAIGDVKFQGNVKDADTLKAEYERRKSRAARFGIPLKEEDKAVQRAARFGVPVTAAATASLAKAAKTTTPVTATTAAASAKPLPAKPGSIAAQIPADVLSKRQERFGVQAPEVKASATPTTTTTTTTKPSGLVLDAAEEEKKRKRAAKFGLTPSSEEVTKKMKA